MRKDFTPSERVAILRAIEKKTRGGRQSRKCANEDEAARKAGFGSDDTAERAERVVDRGTPELVAAMDSGALSISAGRRWPMFPHRSLARTRA